MHSPLVSSLRTPSYPLTHYTAPSSEIYVELHLPRRQDLREDVGRHLCNNLANEVVPHVDMLGPRVGVVAHGKLQSYQIVAVQPAQAALYRVVDIRMMGESSARRRRGQIASLAAWESL